MPVPSIGALPPILPTAPIAPSLPSPSVGAAGAASGAGFSDALAGAVDNLGAVQRKADDLAVQVATGTLENPHDYLIAATEASLTTQMTVAVRNKAIEAFNEIMRMPL